MLLRGLRAYRDKALPPDTVIPASFSVRCVPGQYKFLRVQEYVEPDPDPSPTTIDTSKLVFGQISISVSPSGPRKVASTFFGRNGLDFFVKPGK